MRRLLVVLLIVIVCRPPTAQSIASPNTLVPGARVRVTLLDMEPREAAVVSRTPDTLVVRWREFSNDDAVPFAAIEGFEAAVGAIGGGTIGLVIGTLVGLSRSADWRAVSADPGRLGVAVAPGRQGTRLLASLRF